MMPVRCSAPLPAHCPIKCYILFLLFAIKRLAGCTLNVNSGLPFVARFLSATFYYKNFQSYSKLKRLFSECC